MTVPVDPSEPGAPDGGPRGWRRIAGSPLAAAFVILAVLTFLGRVVAVVASPRLTPQAAAFAILGGLIGAIPVALPAPLLASPQGRRRRGDLMLAGFLIVAVSDVVWTAVSVAFTLAVRAGTPISGFYSVLYIGSPAIAITATVGAVLIPFGLARRTEEAPPRSPVARIGCLGAALWLVLAVATFLQYASGYSRTPIAFGAIAIGLVSLCAWTGTAVMAASRRPQSPRSLGPLALGAGLIAIGGAIEAVTVQLLTSDPSRYRDGLLAVVRNMDGVLGAVGWALVLLAAVRGLPVAPSTAVPDPPDPDPAATMDDP